MAKMSDKHKLMAYLLFKEFGYKQANIAVLMQVSQSTIATAVKEVRFRMKITDLEKQLADTRALLLQQGYREEIPQLGGPQQLLP